MTFDEMAIRKHVEWDGRRFRGYVDVGTDINDDTLPPATEALVFMVVTLDGSWKLPCAYFLIVGMTGIERANLVRECIGKLSAIGVRVVSVTCDGPSCNFNMFKELGAIIDPLTLQSWFTDPSNINQKVCILLDACHMLKLARNTMASQDILDQHGEIISWNYIKKLNELQDDQALRAGNRLRKAHVEWDKQKMKVRLAAQTLSASVADSLEFCMTDMKLPDFVNCTATIKYIRTFDRLFDIFNSRNRLAKYSKSPLRLNNEHLWRPFLLETRLYLGTLRNTKKQLLTSSNRKTAFLGFMLDIDSIILMFDELVAGRGQSATSPLNYLLTYKLSQDHLETFFGCIRSQGGCNNNPTVRQFIAAYKRLLVRQEVKAINGNCIAQDDVQLMPVVHLSRPKKVINQETQQQQNTQIFDLIHKYDLISKQSQDDEQDCADTPNFSTLSQYVENAIVYIGGYVVRNVSKRLACDHCRAALTETDDSQFVCERYRLWLRKNRGGLICPSTGTLAVCDAAERSVRRIPPNQPPSSHDLSTALVSAVLFDVMPMDVFPSLHNHMLETEVNDNHTIQLVQLVANEYIKIRMYHLGKQYTASIAGKKIRTTLSKLILFNHQ